MSGMVRHEDEKRVMEKMERVSGKSECDCSVHYRAEGLERDQDFWCGLSVWSEQTADAEETVKFYEAENEALKLQWRGFRIVKRTIEPLNDKDEDEERSEKWHG